MNLTHDMLAASYDFLRATPPFAGWNMPESDEVEFNVLTTRRVMGQCQQYVNPNRPPVIGISTSRVGHTVNLIRVMAHEMVHLRQAIAKTETPNTEHNAEFHRLGRLVCRHHGFDHKDF